MALAQAHYEKSLKGMKKLDYIGVLKGLYERKARKQRAEELLEMVVLTGVAKRKIKTFSGGMKRRAGIAQDLLNDPQLLIVDEPTAGLDPEERIRFRNLFCGLGDRRTVLLSTHIVEDIAQTCQNLAILRQGQLMFQGTVSQMVQQTRGRVWQVTTAPGFHLQGNFEIVAKMNMGNVMQYRIVGECPPSTAGISVIAADPGLEDSYLRLMRCQCAMTVKS